MAIRNSNRAPAVFKCVELERTKRTWFDIEAGDVTEAFAEAPLLTLAALAIGILIYYLFWHR